MSGARISEIHSKMKEVLAFQNFKNGKSKMAASGGHLGFFVLSPWQQRQSK